MEKEFDLKITVRKDKNVVDIPEGKEADYLDIHIIPIKYELAEKILDIGQNGNEEDKMKEFEKIFKDFEDANGEKHSYDINDIYEFSFARRR